MDESIAAVAVLASSVFTGLITTRLWRRERIERGRDELRAALVAYGAAVDRLGLQIDRLPEPSKMGARLNRALRRWRDLDWLAGRASTALFGRAVLRAVDEFIDATNRLMLIAPTQVLERALVLSALLERIESRDKAWKEEWHDARDALTETARRSLENDSSFLGRFRRSGG